MRVLVLGGSYFIGRALVHHFLDAGHDVSLVNRGSRPVEGTRQLSADRDDEKALTAALDGQAFDWIIDTSCYTGSQARLAYRALAGRFERWVLLSSASLYVDGAPVPVPEDGWIGPSEQWGEYGVTKREAEVVLAELAAADGATATALRAPYIYGPGNNASREDWLWARLLRGRPILVPGAGETPAQFLHTADLARAVDSVLAAPHASGLSVFNIGNPEWCSFRALVEELAAVAGISPRILPVPYESLGRRPREFFPFRDTACVIDGSRARQVLGFTPSLDLAAGLRQTFASYDREKLATCDIDTTVEDEIIGALRDVRRHSGERRSFAARFDDVDVARRYAHRPPYSGEVTEVLLRLLTPGSRVVLDAGCGTGKLARELAPRVDRVDAVDAAQSMIDEGKKLPGGRHPALRWIQASIEEAPLDPPYGLVVAGASFHWFDLDIVLPRFADVLATEGRLVVLNGDAPWQAPWLEAETTVMVDFVTRMTGERPIWRRVEIEDDLLVEHPRFEPEGHCVSAPAAFSQRVEDYVACQHSRATFTLSAMGVDLARGFDAALTEVVAPFADDGVLHYERRTRIEWGRLR